MLVFFMDRSEFDIEPIQVNRVTVSKIIIDSHYKKKHANYMTDQLILNLVRSLDGRIEVPEKKDEDGYSYFATLLSYENKQYRLIWLLEDNAIYIGVLNAYRDDR